ncbi:hypothetical protein CTAYLR_003155 [Chrysophaeum taylorii]|uniref:Band 7 domain-containing protein n=1 Tax=Chrysophaeum taylorii TaxID=2483200 RepID=A0AAD7XNC0_9STRA|nr:hypothetical protein CTAYLR_003155 [Chrysophaeum taylorii]
MVCIVCVNTSEVGVVERCGQYNKLAGPGINCVVWPCEEMVGQLSLRVQSLDVRCETKTLDNVFVDVVVSVQYQVIPNKVYEAFYRLSNPRAQITSYVYDVIRSTLPTQTLDKSFEAKEEIAQSVKESLSQTMQSYGFMILNTLVTDLNPDARVRNAMNDINASKRLKEAAYEKAEGDKVLVVKSAEAEAESKYLSGVGVARQRKAIVDGLRESITAFASNVQGTNSKDIIDLLLVTQYFDMLKDVGSKPNCATVFIPDDED